jgi:hypothetical protein
LGIQPCDGQIVAAVSLDELQAQVVRRYRDLDLPAWPDPHPGMHSPREEEYSRLTNPERHRIVHARAHVWADVLRGVPGVEVESLPQALLGGHGLLCRVVRGTRLTSPRPGTLPLLLLEQDTQLEGQEGSLAVLHISVVQPDIVLETLPDCGCDACDQGSDDLLAAIDEKIGRVVDGPFVALQGKRWHMHWHPDGASSTGTSGRVGDHAEHMEVCRMLAAGEEVRLPRGTTAYVGRSWLS